MSVLVKFFHAGEFLCIREMHMPVVPRMGEEISFSARIQPDVPAVKGLVVCVTWLDGARGHDPVAGVWIDESRRLSWRAS